jgi:F-type H+-transporting ATPase subunit epsilon
MTNVTPLYMQLKILMPSRLFRVENVTRIVAEARQGSLGLLPHRLDCVTALAPGILTYATETAGEIFIAIDEGVLIKTGAEVLISVRHAIGGANLGQLRQAVEREFVTLDERQKTVRTVVAKLESALIRRFAGFHHA